MKIAVLVGSFALIVLTLARDFVALPATMLPDEQESEKSYALDSFLKHHVERMDPRYENHHEQHNWLRHRR